MRQVAVGKSAGELQQTITEQDKAGLNMFVVEQINNLRQKDRLKDIADRVNNIVITDNDAVLRPELWSWLNAAESGIKRAEQLQMTQPTTSTAMAVVPKNKNITFMDKISRLFSKEPIFPLQTIDLRKINIEWLSKYIPKSMLLELENNRLSEENRQVDDRYVPDSRAVIYEVMKNVSGMMKKECEKEYKFIKENGSELSVRIYEEHAYDPEDISRTRVKMNSGNIIREGERCTAPAWTKVHALNETLAYASLLDKAFNTSFQQQLFQEAQDIYIDKKHKSSPVYDNLMLSLKKMLKEYHHTKLDFEATEEAKRKQFYETHRFKAQLKSQDAEYGEKNEVQEVEPIMTQDKDYNAGETEQET